MKEIMEIIEKSQKYNYIGARGLCSDENYKIGDFARNSKDWDFEDDCSSSEDLNGSCAIEIVISSIFDTDDEIEEKINSAVEVARGYGKRVAILCSNEADYGDDENEIVMNNAIVIALL